MKGKFYQFGQRLTTPSHVVKQNHLKEWEFTDRYIKLDENSIFLQVTDSFLSETQNLVAIYLVQDVTVRVSTLYLVLVPDPTDEK